MEGKHVGALLQKIAISATASCNILQEKLKS